VDEEKVEFSAEDLQPASIKYTIIYPPYHPYWKITSLGRHKTDPERQVLVPSAPNFKLFREWELN
jgi:hypothetical protein